jgi:hypothetical protein
MKTSLQLQPVLIALTLLNLGILGVTIFRQPAVAASSPAAGGVLRGSGLEIVDGEGKVRASIAVHPPVRQLDGSIYPETVLFRLITSAGRPIVKISSSEDGAGMSLSAAEGPAYAQILARGNDPLVLIVDGTGSEKAKLP